MIENFAATRKEVGHRIKARRVAVHKTQKDLGAEIGVEQTQVCEWEIGRRALKVEQILAIAKALETTVGYLVGEQRAA